MRKLGYILLFVVGGVSGAAGGFLLSAEPSPEQAEPVIPSPETSIHAQIETAYDYIRLNSQFVIPVVVSGRVKSLVAMSLSLEVKKASGDLIFAREPKLRDVFLRVLFDHANSGGFDGEFTASGNLAALRRALVEAGRQVIGASLNDVLITDIARQDS